METDAFQKHEVLHVVSLFGSIFHDHILEHQFVKSDEELSKTAEEISNMLGNFYQLAGQKAFA